MEHGSLHEDSGEVVVNPETMEFDPADYDDIVDTNGANGDYGDENHIVVKSEMLDQLDYSTIEDSNDMAYGYLPHASNEDSVFQYDDGSEGSTYVRDMVHASPEQLELRQNARMTNLVLRSDCPVCGDRVNGIHYGIYSCEGCKNFFKRSMSIKKPYICGNQGNCDVGVFLDVSGIKRKGTRCQACRFTGCLNAGMIHQGHNRSTGRPRRSAKTSSPNPAKRPKFTNVGSNCYQDNTLNESVDKPEEDSKSILESMLEAPKLGLEYTTTHSKDQFNEDFNNSVTVTPMSQEPVVNEPSAGFEQDNETNKLVEDQNNSALNIVREQLQYERVKNKEFERQLRQKDDAVKSLEVHLGLMEKHMLLSQTLTNKQKMEINKLKTEIKRLGQFTTFLKNSKKKPEENGKNGDDNLDPLAFLEQNHVESQIKAEPYA